MKERLQALWGNARTWYAGHSPRDQRIILGVIAATVLSLIYVMVVVPVRDFRQNVADEIAEGQQQLQRSARLIAALDSLRAEREALKKRLTQARTRLLPGTSGTLGAAALQERANAIASEKGVTVQSTQVMREETIDPYRKVSVRLTLSGELKPFAELLSGLEFGQQLVIPFVEVTRRGAIAGAKGPRTLSATVEVNGFVLAEAPKADDGEGGAAAEGAAPVPEDGAVGGPEATPPPAAEAEPS
ncbi:MAG: type II secretion system protein M [bacterium]|nr:type II secretion system protein M [bacterium]